MAPTTDAASRRWRILAGIALLLAPLLAYLPALNGEFVWDDHVYIVANSLLRDAQGWWRLWIPGQTPQFYPIVFTTFWLEFRAWGPDTTGYHVLNVMLHGLNALLVWRVGERLRLPGAWMIAAVFALHPVHVESVAYISERKNVLSGSFYLLSMLAYLRLARPGSPSEEAQPGNPWAWYTLAMALFVLALLSKSVTCTLPVALGILLLHQRQPLTFRRLLPLGPFVVIGGLLALETARVEQSIVGAVGPEFQFSMAQRLLNAARSVLFYPWKLLWPADLGLIYPRWEFDAGALVSWWPAAAILIVAGIAAVAYARGVRAPALALAFSVVTILPALGLVNFYPMRFSFVADHFQYLASLGVIALVVGSVARSLRGRSLAPLLGGTALAMLGVLTFIQAGTYASGIALWSHALVVNKDAWIAHHNLAAGLAAHGDLVAAEEHYRLALAIKPDYHEGHRSLGDLLQATGRLEESLREYRVALEYMQRIEPALREHAPAFRENPPTAQYQLRIAQVLDALGRSGEAEDAYRAAVAIAPHRVELNVALAMHLAARGRHDQAAELLESSLKAAPTSTELHARLAGILRVLGRLDEALRHLRTAVATAVNEQERLTATRELADLLATCRDDRIRNGSEAVTLAEQVVRGTRRSDPSALITLASAHAELGRFEEAVRAAEEARRLAHSMQRHDLVALIDSRLALFRADTPARE